MPTVQDVVAAYIKLRDQKSALAKRQTDEMAPIRAKMTKVESWLLAVLNKDGADSIKTAAGTCYKTTRVSATVEDWEATINFVKENDLWQLVERRVSKTAVEEFLESTGELPPGVKITSDTAVNIRR